MLKQIEIFKAGSHQPTEGEAIAFSLADLAEMAASYDPAKWKAPLVIGHPKVEDPRYGGVAALKVEGDTLLAEVDQVEPSFAELVNSGRYNDRSASFYRPGAAHNPTPGKWYLKHVGFLGAVAPAVSGLKPAAFAGGEADAVTFNAAREKPGMDKTAEFAAREAKIKTDEAAAAERKKQLETEAAEFAERKKKLDAETAEFAKQQLATRRAADATFLDGLVKAGTLPPAWRDGMVDFMARLDAAEAVQFAQGEGAAKETERAFFERFLKALPAQIDFSVRAGGDGAVDARNPQALADAATAYQAEQAKAGRTVGTADAMTAVLSAKQ